MYTKIKFTAFAALVASARAQQACTLTTETHPSLTWSKCTGTGGSDCTSQSGEVVVDANWRWTHSVSGSTNCYTGNEWNTAICDSDASCATACCVDGANYESTYGVSSSGDALSLGFVTKSSGTNIGSRLYLMASETEYEMFTLLGNEFTFDVDVSNLPCGLNGALYFVQMDSDGGMSRFPNNTAGAKYGTGYCDSQCPRDLKFISGQANMEGWTPSTNDANSGVGNHGSCCAEMDIWEANSISAALTPHPCTITEQTMCESDAECGGTYSSTRYGSYCDPDGCDFNSYRMGNTSFYGSGLTVDTSSVFTVVTQFITDTSGSLSEIKRFYVQNGVVIDNSQSDISGVSGNSITADFCTAQKTAFGDTNEFETKGGMMQMGTALASPMVLVMSLWDDHYANMLWLDSNYPTNGSASDPGIARGTCATSSGVPSDIESSAASSKVVYSNIRFGPIGSTFAGSSSSSSGSSSGSSSSAAASASKAATSASKAATSAAAGTAATKATTSSAAAQVATGTSKAAAEGTATSSKSAAAAATSASTGSKCKRRVKKE